MQLKKHPKNFKGTLFAGSGVNNAVALEHRGNGALLFTYSECAEFFHKNFNEPVFKLGESLVLGWSDDKDTLASFLGISLWQLLKVISAEGAANPTAEKLTNNINYSLSVSSCLHGLMLAILSSPSVSAEDRKTATQLLKIRDPEDFTPFKEITDKWLCSERFSFIKQ